MQRSPSSVMLAPQLARLAVDNVDDAIAILMPRGTALTIEYVNPGFEQMFGYTAKEILGSPIGVLARDTGSEKGILRADFDPSHPHRSEAMLKTKDGNELLVDIDLQPVDVDGLSGGLLVMRDVTEYRRLEQIAAATEVSESVGYVFAGIRHELGNPLNSLKAALTLLCDARVELPDERRMEYLRRSLGEVKRMEVLLEQLRTFNMNESVQLAPIPVRPFLERFIRLVTQDCAARATSIELLPGDDVTVLADPRLLHQILLLLFTNALDAVENAPERIIRLACMSRQRASRITLSDTGVGMTRDLLANVQRPFVTTKSKGTGLGLPLARRYAALIKCRLEIASDPGSGTCTTLEFEQLNSSGA